MNSGPYYCRGNAGRKVAVADEPDTGPSPANVFNQFLMAGTFQDHYYQIGDIPVQGSGDRLQVVCDWSIQVDHVLT
jgi:hypothetical protein